jgi:hypothetical protein
VRQALEVWVLQWQPQVLAAAAAVLAAAEAAAPVVRHPVVVVDKRLLHAYSKGHRNQQEVPVPARVREGCCCTAEQLELERKDCNILAVVVHSLEQEVSAAVAAAAAVVAAAVAAAADVAAAAEDNRQELAVASCSRWVAKHPWVEEDHRDRDVALDKQDTVALD